MTRLRIVLLTVVFTAMASIALPNAHADQPIAFRDTDSIAEEWEVIEALLMRTESEGRDIVQIVDIEFVQAIMKDERLPQADALLWIRENAVAVAYADVTGDNRAEFLVMFFHVVLQGNGAAPTVIMERTAEGWRIVANIYAYDVGIAGDPPPPYPLCVSDERLNGRPYFYSADQVAYWDGEQYRWECVTRCEGSEPGDNPFGEKIARNLRCIDGQ
jgi:hypothetical protein